VHETSGNLNNHIGVPLTLLATPNQSKALVLVSAVHFLRFPSQALVNPFSLNQLDCVLRPDTSMLLFPRRLNATIQSVLGCSTKGAFNQNLTDCWLSKYLSNLDWDSLGWLLCPLTAGMHVTRNYCEPPRSNSNCTFLYYWNCGCCTFYPDVVLCQELSSSQKSIRTLFGTRFDQY
jgi:hypothetical protein